MMTDTLSVPQATQLVNFLDIACGATGEYERPDKLSVRHEIFRLFQQHADISQYSMGFFLPNDSLEIRDLYWSIPQLAKYGTLALITDECNARYMQRYHQIDSYWRQTYGDNKYIIATGMLDSVLQDQFRFYGIKNLSFGHADFYDNWGTKSTQTHKVIEAIVDKCSYRSCFSFTHSDTVRRCSVVQPTVWEPLRQHYLEHSPRSRFSEYERFTPDILTAMSFASALDFRVSVKVVGGRKFRAKGGKGWMDNTTVAINKGRIFCDEELFDSFITFRNNKDKV